MQVSDRKKRRTTVRRSIRRKIRGTPERPRLAVHRTLKHIYCQVIDDEAGRTLAQASTVDPQLREKRSGNNVEAAKAVGELLAQRAKDAGVEAVVFDRGGYLYHGRVRALAEAAREGGLRF